MRKLEWNLGFSRRRKEPGLVVSRKETKTRKFALIVGYGVFLILLVGYGIYQTVYGVGMTIGPNGTMNVLGMPGTTISAPPGSNVSNITVTHGPFPNFGIVNASRGTTTTTTTGGQNNLVNFVDLANGTWTLYNLTTGSSSQIQFNPDGSYDRILNSRDLHGIWTSSTITEQTLQLCPTGPYKWTDYCMLVGIGVDNPNTVGFTDLHGNSMMLMHNGGPVPIEGGRAR